jgi:hypothetical protein
MTLGKYKIEDYTVTIDGIDEIRQKVIYYNIDGDEIFISKFDGDYNEINPNYLTFNGSPLKVTNWQFRTQLSFMPSPNPNFNNLKDLVSYMIIQMTGNEKIKAEEAWDNSNYINRYSPLVLSMAQTLGMNEYDIDQIFIEANNIKI